MADLTIEFVLFTHRRSLLFEISHSLPPSTTSKKPKRLKKGCIARGSSSSSISKWPTRLRIKNGCIAPWLLLLLLLHTEEAEAAQDQEELHSWWPRLLFSISKKPTRLKIKKDCIFRPAAPPPHRRSRWLKFKKGCIHGGPTLAVVSSRRGRSGSRSRRVA